eukprot:TRINITY_DN1944_c0_g3_i1.p1 TRINITY_DN1944_c0_g3~~TRINITY_DN1944_c0_g3_i1.p1  ORF type:complete len:382 (-),score=117.70 TRINITY_DN1944_c0_g3_i1:55-1200(-)
MAQKLMSSNCSNPSCPHLIENARLIIQIEFLKEQLEEKIVQNNELKLVGSAKYELETCQKKCQDFGNYVDNYIKKLDEKEENLEKKVDSMVSKSELAVQSTIDDLKKQSSQISSVLAETRENTKKLRKQLTEYISNEVNGMRKDVSGILGELKNGIQDKFNVEKKFVFQKVDTFGYNLEKRILENVDKKMLVVKNIVEERLDDQNEDIQDLKDYNDDQYNEIENGFKEIRRDVENECKTIKILTLGPYRENFVRLEDNDASHGALLHKMIHDNADKVILSACITMMRLGALQWRNLENNDALDIALRSKRDYDIVKLFVTSIDDLNRRCEALKHLPNGTKVRRGRDWSHGNEDNNNDGIVTRASPIVGRYYVEWKDSGESH